MDKPHRQRIYGFENFRLDAAHRLLYQNGQEIPLTPKVVETLLALVERSGEVLSKDELMEIIWADSFVEEGNLSQNLYILRKILSETADGRPFIETLKRRGYRFNGDVVRLKANTPENSLSAANQSSAKITNETSDGDFENEVHQSRTTANSSAIVGREKEIAQIKNLLLQTDVRLVTLAGVGGTGKTKLAQAVMREMEHEFTDGVFFIELAAITNHELVVPTIAQYFGIKEKVGTTILENLFDYLRNKKLLIVADNFEQVADDAPNLVKLLTAAENIKFLITSRVLLRLRAEREFIVPPLALPEEVSNISLDELSNYGAIKLFVERAQDIKSNFALTAENADAVTAICRQLDGLPLAIELAAARLKILAPPAILAKLENRLKLLTGGASDLPARQQTMRGAIEWSYNLLTADEQSLLRRVSIFTGGFSFEAAEFISGSSSAVAGEKAGNVEKKLFDLELNEIEALNNLTSLINQSLIVIIEQPDGERRFRMLETIREYALESLDKNAETQAAERRYAAYFLRLIELAEPHLSGADSTKWHHFLKTEHDNLVSVLTWSLEHEVEMAARLAKAINYFWKMHGHLSEGREWFEFILLKSEKMPAEVRFTLFNGLGNLTKFQGDFKAARNYFEQALAIAGAANDLSEISRAVRGLATVAYRQNDYLTARKYAEQGLSICRRTDDQIGIAASLITLGDIARSENEISRARTFFEESLAISQQIGSLQGIGSNYMNLGFVTFDEDDIPAAHFYFKEALKTAQQMGEKNYISFCFDGFAALAAKCGHLIRSVRLAGAAQHLRNLSGYQIEPAERRFREAYLAKLRAALHEPDFTKFYEQGGELKLEKVIAICQE